MPPIRRRLRAAAFILFGLAAAGTGALAQEASNTIGPPQLKDFSLPGQRTTPPATPPAPSSTAPSTTTPSATPPREQPAARRAANAGRPAPRRDTAAPPPSASAPVPQAAAPAPPETALPPIETQTQPQPQPQPQASAPETPAPQGIPWPWLAAGAAFAALLAAFLLLRRRRAEAARQQARDAAREELGGVLFAAPEPAPEPEPEPQPEAAAPPRPWLELDIAPDRAAATDSEALVHYALTLTNQGDAAAGNIRIDPRLFNAGAEGEMAAFFQGPMHEQSGSPHIVIAPGGTLKLNGQVAMPMAEVREIEMAGRRIFVPMVAINVAYDWAGGTGRTSRSWLVGREAEVPTEKMGPFRLDLGPRIYRSVGRREARLVMV